MEMELNMIESKHLLNEYWAEAIATVIDSMKRCPTMSVKNMDMYEWQYFEFSIFCCVVYSPLLDDLRNKLDNKGPKYIYVGYSEDTKAYKLYHPITIKVIINCYVQFVENESWDGTIKKNVNVVSTVEHYDMTEEVVQTSHVS